MTWKFHINNIVKKARARLGLVKRTLGHSVSTNVKNLCYKALVRPVLEYCTSLWSPNNKNLLLLIESVQRNGTKYILGDFSSDYHSILTYCNLLPLSYHREYLDMVLMFNALYNFNDLNIDSMLNQNDIVNLRSNETGMLASKYLPRTELFANFFPVRIVKCWNKLPVDLRNMDGEELVNSIPFKKQLKEYYTVLLHEHFTVHNTCTWTTCCRC